MGKRKGIFSLYVYVQPGGLDLLPADRSNVETVLNTFKCAVFLPFESKNVSLQFFANWTAVHTRRGWQREERALGKTTEGSNVDAYGISDLKTLCCFRWVGSHAPHPVFRIETIPPSPHLHTHPLTLFASPLRPLINPVSRVPSLRPIGILKSFSLAQNNFSKKRKKISNKCAGCEDSFACARSEPRIYFRFNIIKLIYSRKRSQAQVTIDF